MFIGSGESIESIQSSQSISICTIFWFISYFSYLLHQWEKNEQLNKRWKNTKSQQVEHWLFESRKFVKNLLTVWNRKDRKKSKADKSKAFYFWGEKIGKFKKQVEKKRKAEKSKQINKNEKLKSRKVRMPRLFEHLLTFCKKSHPKSKKKTKSRKNEKSKSVDFLRTKITGKHRKFEYFLTFCEKFCDFRAVRLPARGALRTSKQF